MSKDERSELQTYACPSCGKEVRIGAPYCSHCQVAEPDDSASGLDLPDDDFDYDKFVEQEFGKKAKSTKKEIVISVIALVLIIVWVLGVVI